MFDTPQKSHLLKRLEVIKKRGGLNSELESLLYREWTGFEGESWFYRFLESELVVNPLVLYDVRVPDGSRECQIDCILIFQDEIVILEVKNYKGEYEIVGNNWKNIGSRRDIEAPLVQLERATRFVRNLFVHAKIDITISSYLILVNDDFYLYNHSKNLSIKTYTQLKRFVRDLNYKKDYLQKWHYDFVDHLKTLHLPKSKYAEKFEFNIDTLQKGLYCEVCDGQMAYLHRTKVKCKKCGAEALHKDALARAVRDYHDLFPERRITVRGMSYWIDYTLSRHIIREFLKETMKPCSSGRSVHYEFY